GWKFADQEMRGFPMRIEIGPKDIERGECVLVRRDTREKIQVKIEDVAAESAKLLETIQKDMYERALAFRIAHTYEASTYDEFRKIAEEQPGFIKAYWCGDEECENKIKADTTCTSRCMPFGSEGDAPEEAACICCGRKARRLVYWGKAY
ncbi:MAG TPA: proline--tRNA ligase, partial [Lachnospiraceae bacterium]|nr:proline--tRNA ligase [Lachnospiraceae bacterium]